MGQRCVHFFRIFQGLCWLQRFLLAHGRQRVSIPRRWNLSEEKVTKIQLLFQRIGGGMLQRTSRGGLSHRTSSRPTYRQQRDELLCVAAALAISGTPHGASKLAASPAAWGRWRRRRLGLGRWPGRAEASYARGSYSPGPTYDGPSHDFFPFSLRPALYGPASKIREAYSLIALAQMQPIRKKGRRPRVAWLSTSSLFVLKKKNSSFFFLSPRISHPSLSPSLSPLLHLPSEPASRTSPALLLRGLLPRRTGSRRPPW